MIDLFKNICLHLRKKSLKKLLTEVFNPFPIPDIVDRFRKIFDERIFLVRIMEKFKKITIYYLKSLFSAVTVVEIVNKHY